jgi:DNA-binding transcriptional LysR family regulator
VDLLQLEHFLAVVEERTFTRAAERVRRTQPAVSQSIKKLEDEVGAPLFARDVHEVSLTEAGRVLADYARRIVNLRNEAVHQVSELKALKAGTLAIAAHESAAVYLLPAPLRAYLKKFPDIKIGIYRSRLHEIPRQVMDREVDLGFVKDEPAFHELQWVEVHADEMVCIASPSHPLARRDAVSVRDLRSEQFVIHHLCSTTAEAILRLFEQNAARCRIVAELWSFENIKTFVQEDVGMAIVPGVTVRQELRDGTLVRIPLRELSMPRRTLMVYREQGYLSDSARELIKIVRAFNWDLTVPRDLHRPAAASALPSIVRGRRDRRRASSPTADQPDALPRRAIR